MEETIKLPEYTELIEVAVNWEYGSIHEHEEIAGIMGLKARSHKYYSHVNSAIKKLLEKSKLLKVVKGKGYMVVLPDQYLDESISKINQAKRRTAKGYKIATYAPVANMSTEAKSKFEAYVNRLYTFKALVEGTTVELKQLVQLKPKILINKD